MPVLVEVQDLQFEETIELLRLNEHIKEAIADSSEEQVFSCLKKLLSKLKKGEAAEHFVIGMAFAQCLEILGRVFMRVPGEKDDFVLVPLIAKDMSDFAYSLTDWRNRPWEAINITARVA